MRLWLPRHSAPEDNHASPDVPRLSPIHPNTLSSTLVDKPVPSPYSAFISSSGITHIICPVDPNKPPHSRTTTKQVAAALSLLADPRSHPVLVHCNSGKHRSGCVTAGFRKCIGWTADAVLEEYARYAGTKARALDVAFIHAFDERELLEGLRRDALRDAFVTPVSEEPSPPLSVVGRSRAPCIS